MLRLVSLMLIVSVAGCFAPAVKRCPDCVVLDGYHVDLPRLKPATTRLFVLAPGLLGYGWEWEAPVRQLRATPHADFVVFAFDPWGSLDRAARELRGVIANAVANAPPSVREVIVVAHSAAGLIAARALAGLEPPPRALTLVTIGTPFAGMHICPCSETDMLHAPLMLSVSDSFAKWPPLPAGVRLIEYVTSYPSDPVMHPYNHKPVAPRDIGPPGAVRIDVDPKLGHSGIVEQVIADLLRAK
jgi:hypothetical protein